MNAEDSPFPAAWWGLGLPDAGLAAVRPRVGTYGRYDVEPLPPVPDSRVNDLAWLTRLPAHRHHIGNEKSPENTVTWPGLRAEAERMGLALPPAFVEFIEDASLPRHIRSATDCYLDLSAEPIRSPVGDGHLIRFLNDSQGCLFWSLFLPVGVADHAVVCSTDLYGPEASWREEEPDPDALDFCAETFAGFLWRFWIENELWYWGSRDGTLPVGGAEYIEHYLRGS